MDTEILLNVFSVVTKVITSFSVLVSTPLYISVLWFIMKRRKRNPYKSPFYTIFVALGVADLASYYLYMFKKGSYWGWIPYFFKPYEVSNLPATCLYFLIWLFAFSQFQLNILIVLNRFFSIMTPFLYEKVWTNGVTHLLIALIYIEAGCGALPIFWQSVVFTVTVVSTNGTSNITKVTGPVFQSLFTRKVYNDVWRLHIYTILAVCVFCYFCMFLRIRKLDVLSKNEKMAMELKMFYSVLVLLVANIFYTCYFLARDTLEQTYKEFDIYDLHNPIGLLITSSEIRQAAFPFCFLSRNNVQIFNTVTNSSRGGNAAKKENNSYGGFPSAKVASTRNITAISNR